MQFDEKEFLGLWWIPENKSKKIGGLLRYNSKEGMLLELTGFFKTPFKFEKGKTTLIPANQEIIKYPVILGYLKDKNKKITLYNCYQKSFNLQSGFSSEQISSSIGLIGGHFDSIENVKFKHLKIYFNTTTNFLLNSGFNIKIETENSDSLIIKNYELNYSFPDPIFAQTNYGKFKIEFEAYLPFTIKNRMVLEETPNLYIYIEKEISLERWFTEYIIPLKNFFQYVTTKPTYLKNLIAYSIGDGSQIDVLFQQDIFSDHDEEFITIDKMLLIYEDVENFSLLLNNWFKFYSNYKSTCNLYFNIENSPKLDLKNQFLNITQAIEIYHREKFKDHTNWPYEEFKKRVDVVLHPFSGKYRKWIKSMTKYANEPNLKNRLIKLFSFAAEILDDLFDDHESFFKKVVDTRNYFIHNNSKLKNKIFNDLELFWAVQKLKLLLQACILLELGFSNARAKDIFNRNDWTRRVKIYSRTNQLL